MRAPLANNGLGARKHSICRCRVTATVILLLVQNEIASNRPSTTTAASAGSRADRGVGEENEQRCSSDRPE